MWLGIQALPTCRVQINLSPHAASTYGIAPARLTRPWILYGTSEQSRWAPQLGQRLWHACMSIIVCPHMGHSFFLPAAIHHAQGSASYYSFWQTQRLRPSGLCALAPRSPSVCLDRRCTLSPRLRGAAELKFVPSKCRPLATWFLRVQITGFLPASRIIL